MTRDPAWDILFEPVRIGPKVLRNRFYQVPHALGAGSERPGMQAAFRELRAEGGWAAVCVEACSIDPECDFTLLVSARLWDDDDVRSLAATCEAVHRHGALAGVELDYAGAESTCLETRAVPRGPSQLAGIADLPVTPAEMTLDDIRELQALYAAAAVRARDAGFDIVYVYGGSDELPAQFLLPRFNRRTDAYGGSFENRARFWLETLEQVRAAVGADCAIATRISVDRGKGYIGLDEACRFVELANDLVDLWDVKMGSLPDWGWDAGSSRFFGENYQARWLREVRSHATKPVVGTGRFTSPDTMAEVVRTGELDLIGAARPAIADPFLPRKIEEGRLDDVRGCIGCNVCCARNIVAAQIVCTQNATAGEEYRRGWHPERFARLERRLDVLVVGAGPAGLECARVLGERGAARVRLVEAGDEIGGHLRWLAALPGLDEWRHVVDYRRRQIAKLANVEVVTGRPLDAAGVLASGSDVVVVATGARWAGNGVSGRTPDGVAGADAALTPEQVALGSKPVGDSVVVFDCDGNVTGVCVAEKLARQGRRVTLVTPFDQVAPFLVMTGEAPDTYRLLRRLGVVTLTGRSLRRIEPGLAIVFDAFFGDGDEELEAASVVLVTQRLSNDELYRELLAAPSDIHVLRAGDCVAPRLLADAIFDGHRVARELEPRPLPYLRERPGPVDSGKTALIR